MKMKQILKEMIFIGLGVLSAGFGLKGFLLPNKFIDGGVTGISLLVSNVFGFSLPVLLIIINIPFIIMAFSQVGRKFAFQSMIAIAMLALAVGFIPYPHITEDKLLIAAFGGFFLGTGIGLSIRGGAVIDGTEVAAIYLSKKTGLTIGDLILIFNVLIFAVAAYVLSIETALYAILTYLAAAKTVDFVIEGIEEYNGITIISEQSDSIRKAIIELMGRGVTIYLGKGGYNESPDGKDILFTVVTRLELNHLKSIVDGIDENAFVVISGVKNAKGGIIKKRPLAH